MIPDTFFSASPHWGWLITLYFFFGGIAGGALFLSGLLHFSGRSEDRPQVRRGHYIAFAGALSSGLLLTLDLTRPLRFWHMLFQPDGSPMFKPWSPMSVGAWGLLVFSGVAMLSATASAAEEGRIRWRAPARLASGVGGATLAVAGVVSGLFLAGYTGVLLAVTNRPIWSDSTWLGALFLLSGISTAVAALVLVGRGSRSPHGAAGGVQPITDPDPRAVPAHGGVSPGDWLMQFDRRIKLLELLVLVVFIVSLGAVARTFVSAWGVLLVVGVVGLGIVLPLTMEHRNPRVARAGIRAPLLVLLGGLLLRAVVIFASEQVSVTASGLIGSGGL
jgi:formate-dependent nitrite reductase membrane component NrfD